MTTRYRWRVFFTEGTPPRDVTAFTVEAAKRTAIFAERVTCNTARKPRVRSVERLFEVGWRAQEELFPSTEETTTDEPADDSGRDAGESCRPVGAGVRLPVPLLRGERPTPAAGGAMDHLPQDGILS